jgi:aspartate/methionine/tyrosine aminotransferase
MADKIWGNYRLTFVVRKKAKLEHFRLFSDKQGFDLIAFEEKIVELKSKMNKLVVLLNFPNNPTGYAPTKEEANSISEILLKHCSDEFKIVAVIDDAYFGLFYEEDVFKSSVFSLIAGKNENLMAIKLDAATKEDYVWGFRTGFITYAVKTSGNIEKIYNALEKKTGGAIRGNISNCPNISQAIMCKVLSSDTYQQEKEEKVGVLKARANKVKEILLNKKFDEVWDMYPFNSGYFMCVKLKNIDAEEFRKYLLKEYGIGVIAPNSTDIRVAFSSVDLKDIPELFEDMYEAALKYKG